MSESRRQEKVKINPLGFGTDGVISVDTFKLAIEQGYRLFDSADLYKNVEALSEAIRQSNIDRQHFFINYKIFPDLGVEEFKTHVDEAINNFGYIDCLMLHNINAQSAEELTAILEMVRQYVVSENKLIRHIGISNVNSSELGPLLKEFPEIKLVQNKFNHVEQDADVRKLCRENDVEYIGYGLFGGKYDGSCVYNFNPEIYGWNLSELVFPVINEMAKKYETTPHVMLLAWAILQKTTQIPRGSSQEHMTANLSALKISKQINETDINKLNMSLNTQLTPTEWELVQRQAAHNDHLSMLKMMVGNNAPRHRLLDILYQDDYLKSLYDLLLDKNSPAQMLVKKEDETYVERWVTEANAQANSTKFARWQKNSKMLLVMHLTHFMEMCLKEGKGEFDKNIDLLKSAFEKCTTLSDKTGIYELLYKLGNQKPYIILSGNLKMYNEELSLLEQSGCFEIKEIIFPSSKEERFKYAGVLNLGVVGSDNIIYIIKNIPTTANLQDLKQLLADKVPDDFGDHRMLESFYIPSRNQNMDTQVELNLNELWICHGEVIGTKDQEISSKLFRLFHSVTHEPEAFTKDRFSDLTRTPKK